MVAAKVRRSVLAVIYEGQAQPMKSLDKNKPGKRQQMFMRIKSKGAGACFWRRPQALSSTQPYEPSIEGLRDGLKSALLVGLRQFGGRGAGAAVVGDRTPHAVVDGEHEAFGLGGARLHVSAAEPLAFRDAGDAAGLRRPGLTLPLQAFSGSRASEGTQEGRPGAALLGAPIGRAWRGHVPPRLHDGAGGHHLEEAHEPPQIGRVPVVAEGEEPGL